MSVPVVDIGGLYAASRQRICALVLDVGDDEARRLPVQACPGWSVHDVVAHLLGIVEDGLARRLSGPPDPSITADEVTRHRDDPIENMASAWERSAPAFEAVLTERRIWSAMFDVLSHEHDIRSAIGKPGARDDAGVIIAAQRLAVTPDIPVVIEVAESVAAGEPNVPDVDATVTASAFEIFRFRLGRRSIEQVLALPWSGDPTPYVSKLFVFGPADQPLVE